VDTSGNIRRLCEGMQPRENEIPLDEEQAKTLSAIPARKRKNWMRNRPCPCGSGKKFKQCCWSKLSETVLTPEKGENK